MSCQDGDGNVDKISEKGFLKEKWVVIEFVYEEGIVKIGDKVNDSVDVVEQQLVFGVGNINFFDYCWQIIRDDGIIYKVGKNGDQN